MKRQKEKIGRKILSFVLTVALIVSNMTGIVPGTSLKALAVDDITISSVEDWNSFAASVKGGETYSGKTVTLTADVGPVTTMADGSFSGTFDGGGHTLTVNISGGAVATFNVIKGGTIKNLNLAGSVTGSEFHSAALLVKVDGSCTIDKVNVAVTVNSSTNYAGGFIGHGMTGNTISITNSEFSGSINGTGSQALYFGGFFGWCGKSTATIENCAFAGTYSNVKSFNAVGFSCGAMQKVSVSDFYSNAADIYGYTGNSGTRMYNPAGGQQAVAARVDSSDTRTYYNTLSSALENWTDGSTLALLADATTSGGITLSESGASKTLDLNGRTLTPGGSVSVEAGSLTLLGTNGGELKRDVQVINVSEGATFNLEGGTVSGTSTKDQSAINGHGTFNLNGGTVQSAGSNALSLYGKATLNLNGSMVCATSASTKMATSSAILTNAESDITINVSGGTISTNTGCGIYTRGTGTTVNISGGVFTSTTGNYAVSGDNQKNINLSGNPKMEGKGIYLLSGKKITINGELTNTTPIGVTMQTVGVFTDSAEVAFNDAGKFTSDDAAYMVGKNADGQLYLDTAVTATFETEHGTAPASQTIVTGAKITLPDAPEVSGYTFGGWHNGSTTYEAGTEVTLDASKTFTAQWTQVANLVIKQGDYIRMGAYNGYDVDWFCAKVNATGVMMMSKYVITNSRFGANATYKTSDIHAWLDLDSGGWFATDLGLTKKELSLVRTVNLAGTNGDGTDSFIIPAYGNNEMNKGTGYTQAGYINNPSSIASVFWLRTPRDSSNARVVRSQDATVVARYSGAVYGGRGVRPMFYLNTNAIKNMPYTGSGTADDPYSFVPQTGRGTQADPYVFYPRHYIYTDVSIGGSISASASRDDIVIYKAEYKGVQTNKLVEEAQVTLTVKPATGYVFDDILIRLNSPTATNVNAKLTALSGTQGKNTENYEELVDGEKSGKNNKWCLDFNAANPPYIIVKADTLVAMTGYSLTTGNDTNSQGGRNWKDWTIYGANFASDSEATVDSDKWKVVTSVSNDNKLEAKNYTTYDYALESEAEPYQYYKIVITASKGQALIQMSEFTMTGNTYEKLDVTQDGDSYTFMMPKKYDVNDVKVKATFLGTVYFLKKDVNEQWTAVANAEKAWFAGSTYNVTDEIANKYSAEKYAFKGYSLNYSDSGEYTAASGGQAISLGTGQSPLYLYYELERNDLVIYQDAAGKAVYKTVNLPYGASLAGYANEVPEAQDYYTFAGWSTTKNLDSYDTTKLVDWSSLTMNGAMIEVYPIWVHDRVEVKLSLGYDDSKNIDPFFVELDGSINTAGQNMTRDGYDLEGWYTQNGTKWDDAWKVTPEYCDVDAEGNSVVRTDNEKKYNYYILTLTAHWKSKTREVIYATGEHVKDGTTAPANGSVTMGNALTLASAPEAAEGWLFTGWKDANNNLYSAGGSFSFNDWSVVGTDDKITLTAQYVEKAKVKLFFETNGGTVIEPITEYAGTEISLANYITTRAGYTFTKWSDGINEYSSTGSFQVPDSGTEMVTLTAGWTVNQYTVSFDTLGGTGVGSITQDYGSTITTPENPTKDHYEFKGWYPEFPTTMPSENITLKAIWEPISYTVKFMNGDAEYDSISGIYGAEITAPVDPTKDDYVFDGWKDAENKKLTFPAYISGSETYTASWRKAVSYVVTFKVANGQWDNGDTKDLTVILNGYEGDALKLSAAQIPAVGTKPNDTFKAGSWNVTPDTATIISDSTAYTYTYAQKDVISREVTFKVVDGTWNDGTNDDKTVTLTCYEGEEATLKLSATKIPEVGIKPAEGYMEGDWDEIPDTENALTENVTYIYIYTAKEEASVTKEPAANNLTYNGGTQTLATAGEASGGTMEYAVGTDETAEPAENAYGKSIPERTNAGTYYVWYRVSPDATHSGTAPACVKVEIAKKTITISGITADDKEFDNTKDVTLRFNEIDWLSCGMVEGDSLNITASGSFSDANIGTGKTVSITGLILGGSSVANYMLAETGQQAETTANISPKTLTGIAAANVEVTYDGAEHTITVTGVPEGATVSYGTNADSITLTQAPSYVNANETAYTIYYKVSCANSSDFTGSATVKINKKAATITANNTGKTYGSNGDPELTAIVSGVVGTEALNYTLSRKAGENVGEYEITVTLGENPNYEVTAKNGTFTIGKKAATVTAKAAGKVYGDTDPELTATVEGVVGTDALNYSLARADGEKADEYAITVTLGSNPNYEVTTVGNTFTISKKTATVTADAKNKIFGENDPKLTATVTGLVGEDTLNYSLSREEGENTNNYEITVTLGENPNYEVTATNGVFTIKKANLSTAGAENVNAVYDGEGHGITVIGIPEGATLTYGTSADDITLTQAPTFVDARDIAYTVYYKVISANYNDFVSAATVKIDKRDITITADDKSSKYGTDLQELTYQISNGSIVNGDDLGIGLTTAASKTAYVNTYAITVSWNGNTNYNATLENGIYTITRADLTVSASGYNGIYDGVAHGITVDVGTSGEIVYYAEDELTEANYNVAGSVVAPTYVNAGIYSVYYYVVPTNYDPQPVKGSQTVNIDKKALTITADSDSKVYDTTALTKNSYTSEGLVAGDSVESVTFTGSQTNVGNSANVPSAAVIKKGDADVTANYDITYANGALTVTKALTNNVTVSITGWTYGDSANTPSSTADFGADTVVYSYSDAQDGTFTTAVPTMAGTWYVKASVAGTDDYVGGSAVTSFVIAQKALTITADSDSKVYDTTALTKDSYTSDGLVTGDSIESVTITGAQTSVGSSANTPSAAVIKKGDTDVTANYAITYANGTLTVTKALTNTVTVDITGWTYGDGANAPGSTADFGADTVVYTYSDAQDGTFTATVPVNAGTWYVKATVAETTDYNGGSAVTSFVIAQKALTITADSDSKVYDTTALTKDSYTSDGLVTGDSIESVTITGTQTSVGSSANVPSAAVIKKGDADVTANYDITYANGALTVTKALTNNVTVSITGWTYGDDANAPSSTADFGADTVVYSYSDAQDGTFTTAVPTMAGTWYVKASVAGTDDYVGGSAVTSFVIAQKALTITADSDTKVYDTTALTKNSYTSDGLATGDSIESVTITGAQTSVGSSANTPSAAVIKKGDTDVTANYAITYANGTLTVTKAMTNTVTVDITGWTYGENANTPSSTANFGADTAIYTYSDAQDGTFTTAVPTTAGTWYVKASVAGTDNYVEGSAVTGFEIAQKALTITADSDERAFTGQTLTKNSYTSEGLVAGDSVESVTVTGSQTNVGNSANIPSAAVIKNGDADVTANYAITYVNGTLTIVKAPVNTVTVSLAGWTYGENANAPSSTANFGADTAIYTYSDAQDGTFTATVPVNAGTWYVKATVAETTDYNGGSAVTSFVIAQKALTITADSDSKVYDTTALTKDSYTSDGLVTGDSIESVTITGAQTNVGNSVNVPSAAVIKKGDTDVTANYAITYTNGTLTVTKALTNNVTVSITGWTYGDGANAPGSTADFGADTVVYTYSDAQDGTFTTAVPTTAGTWYVKASVAGTDDYVGGSAVTSFVIGQKAITITADSDSKVYDTTALTKDSYTNTALATGDSIESVTITGTQTSVGSSANVPSAAVIKKGDADVTANYDITYTNGTLTVTKAMTNTVTVSITGWTYGDDANAPSSTADFGVDMVVYSYSDAQDGIFTADVPVNAGTWYVKASVAGTDNYVEGSAVTSFVIGQKAVTITADSDSKAYDTTALTKDSYTNTALATGDSIESVTITGTQTSVGSSANVPSAAVIKKGDTDVTANYDIAYANGTLTVTKAMTNNVTVSITGWTYGDDANAPSSTADFGADTVVYTYSDKADGTFTGAVPTHAGLWFVKAYVPGTENYVEGAAITSFNIAKKAVTVTAEAKSKTYGDADPDLTYVTEGLVGSDTLTGSLARAEGANVGTYAITQGTVDSNDYAITYVGANLTINRREIVISGINANDKDYDGNTDATLDYQYVTYGNIVAADAGKISVSAVGTFEDAQIGKGKTVSITGLTLSGEAIGNYVLAAEGQQEATTADICELENVTTDTNFVAKVKDFEGQVPTVTGLDLALALSLLTPAELAQYTNGEKLELSLEINKAGALMTDDVITLVTNALKDQENAKLDGAYYLDITLYVKVGNGAPRKITDLGGKTISITLDVPEDMYNHIWENRRTYYIVGVHSGVANVHASTTDHKITFDVGGFSVFALCYADVNVITYPSNTGSGTTATTAVTTVSPKTGGEDATDRLLLLMGTISAMIAIAAKVYEFRRRKEEE